MLGGQRRLPRIEQGAHVSSSAWVASHAAMLASSVASAPSSAAARRAAARPAADSAVRSADRSWAVGGTADGLGVPVAGTGR